MARRCRTCSISSGAGRDADLLHFHSSLLSTSALATGTLRGLALATAVAAGASALRRPGPRSELRSWRRH